MIRNTLSALVALAFALSASAAETSKVTYKVNGTTAAGTTTLMVNSVQNNKLDMSIDGIAAVWKTDPGPTYGATKLQSEDGAKGVMDYVLSYTTNPAAFEGARQCILKRGADWPGTGDLKSLKLDDPRVACAPITGAKGTYAVDVAGDYTLLGIVPVIEFKDGTRAWGSHPFGQSRGKNVRGLTITLVELIREGDKAISAAPASDGAKKFFRGQFN